VTGLGQHFLIEYHGCNPEILDNLDLVKDIMISAAKYSGATILNTFLHKFSPQGVSGVVVIAESHLAIHTWPEYKYAAVDIFTCGTNVDPWVAFNIMKERLQSTEASTREISRGKIPYQEIKKTGQGFL
jgi:spermidine synthase